MRATFNTDENPDFIVMGDCDRLQQVVCNLLTNAIKFTPTTGSVTIELSLTESKNRNGDSFAEIRIIDTGIGISAAFLPHVFDRFRQAEKSGSAGGLGLGLAITQHLTKLHLKRSGCLEAPFAKRLRQEKDECQGIKGIDTCPVFISGRKDGIKCG